jgi:hypothetical protein
MAITYPISIPRQADIRSIEFTMMDQVASSQSIYSYDTQHVALGGQRWMARVDLVPMTQARARAWIAFFGKLKGPLNTFYLGDYAQQTVRGSAATAAGTPVVDGASQTGAELAIDGCPELATGYLLEGDYISLGTSTSKRLYMVLEDVNIDSGGSAVLDIYPSLQTTPADNDTVTIGGEGVFRLLGKERSWRFQNNTYQISFECFSDV